MDDEIKYSTLKIVADYAFFIEKLSKLSNSHASFLLAIQENVAHNKPIESSLTHIYGLNRSYDIGIYRSYAGRI